VVGEIEPAHCDFASEIRADIDSKVFHRQLTCSFACRAPLHLLWLLTPPASDCQCPGAVAVAFGAVVGAGTTSCHLLLPG